MKRINIIQGEIAVADTPDTVISTLLGSCVAVCLHDGTARLGGMNHFLLGEPGGGDVIPLHEMQRYGIHAMELLINGLMAKGAARHRLKAHLYGGANMITGLGSIGSANAAFAERFMRTEGIPIGLKDLGGASARRVEFMPFEGRSRCSKVADRVPTIAAKPVVPAGGGELELF